MSSPEVDWVLDQFTTVIERASQDYDAAVRLADRDESLVYKLTDTGTTEVGDATVGTTGGRTATGELQEAAYIGVTHADVASEAIGSGYDHKREAVVGVRIEGLHHSEWGHIDPDGANGIPFDDAGGLVDMTKDAVLDERTWPAAGGPGVTYTDLLVENEAPQSSNYADYYRTDFDIRFRGYEDLP